MDTIFVAFDECGDSYVQNLGMPLGYRRTLLEAVGIPGVEYVVELLPDSIAYTNNDETRTWKLNPTTNEWCIIRYHYNRYEILERSGVFTPT